MKVILLKKPCLLKTSWNESWFKWRSVYTMTWPDRNTVSFLPYSLREVRWFFNVPVNHFREEKTKTAHSPQYFTTLSVGPVWSLNPRPPPRQSGALLRESANRQSSKSGFHFLDQDHFPFRFPPRNISGIIFPYVIRTICNRLNRNVFFF